MPGFAIRAAVPVVIHRIHVETRRRAAHGTGARFHPRKVAGDGDGFGLAVALGDGQAGSVPPRPHRLRVQWLACADRPAEGGEVVSRLPMLREQAIDRRRRAEGGDAASLDHAQKNLSFEPAGMVMQHDRGAEHELREQQPPGRLRPAGVGDRPVPVLRRQVHPVEAGQRVRPGVGVVTRNHFWQGGRTGGEIGHHLIGRRRGWEGVSRAITRFRVAEGGI